MTYYVDIIDPETEEIITATKEELQENAVSDMRFINGGELSMDIIDVDNILNTVFLYHKSIEEIQSGDNFFWMLDGRSMASTIPILQKMRQEFDICDETYDFGVNGIGRKMGLDMMISMAKTAPIDSIWRVL